MASQMVGQSKSGIEKVFPAFNRTGLGITLEYE